MSKVLVTGANSFLAGNVIIELLSRGYRVKGMIRKSASLITGHTNLELFYGNITEEPDVINALKGCDIVIHTAAVTDQSIADYNIYETINIGGTRNIINAAIKHSVKKIIYISTANAFGYGTKSEPGNETMPARFPFTLSGYARSKMRAQEIILEEFKLSDTSVTVVNPTFMIGPNDQKPGSNRILLRALDKKLLFIPPGGKNFIHVRDAAIGTCNAIDMGKDGECYILAGENLSYKEFYLKMAEVTGKNPVNIIIPEGLLRLSGFAGNALRAAGMNTQVSSTNMRIISLGNYYSSDKATRDLKLPHTSTEIAIQEAISWFRNKK